MRRPFHTTRLARDPDTERAFRISSCRYAVRPPFALHRLSHGEDGRLVYRMKRPRGGSPWHSLMSLPSFAASIIIPRMGKPPSGASPDAIAVTRSVIAAALNEGAGFFAIVAWMVAGGPWALLALTVSLGGLLRAFPSRGRWKALDGEGLSAERDPNRLVR